MRMPYVCLCKNLTIIPKKINLNFEVDTTAEDSFCIILVPFALRRYAPDKWKISMGVRLGRYIFDTEFRWNMGVK